MDGYIYITAAASIAQGTFTNKDIKTVRTRMSEVCFVTATLGNGCKGLEKQLWD